MWKCIRCEKENQDFTEECVNCGHGRTMDYTGHRVLSKVKPEITDTWKYAQINPDILKIQAGQYLLKAESLLKISGEDNWAKKIREMYAEIAAEAFVYLCEGADLSNVSEKPMLIPDNVCLSGDSTATYSVLGSKFLRKDVCEIDFVKMSLDDIPSGAWDVSADRNGKIWAWMDETSDGYILNIGSEYGVYANTNCSGLFGAYGRVKKIEFNNLFDTSCVMDMDVMFGSCVKLTELDVSGFKTDKVRSMDSMFSWCNKLDNLDLSKFETDSVENMSKMFFACKSLRELNVSKFDTKKVIDMTEMFGFCEKLTELDVSGFKTDKVRSMAGMFEWCSKLESLDVSKFDIKNVTDMTEMFRGCNNLKELNISNFHFREDVKTDKMFEYSGVEKILDGLAKEGLE